MPKNNTAIKEFVDSISDDKLKNFVSTEKTIVENRKIGFRLDHQGVNTDGSSKDRLYIQPLGCGKSRASQMPAGSVIAQIHVTDPGNPKKILSALLESFKDHGKLIKLA